MIKVPDDSNDFRGELARMNIALVRLEEQRIAAAVALQHQADINDKHFAELNNAHARAEKALADADTKLKDYVLRQSYDEQQETVKLRISTLEGWRERIGGSGTTAFELSKLLIPLLSAGLGAAIGYLVR